LSDENVGELGDVGVSDEIRVREVECRRERGGLGSDGFGKWRKRVCFDAT
jgi:hypothetical protein